MKNTNYPVKLDKETITEFEIIKDDKSTNFKDRRAIAKVISGTTRLSYEEKARALSAIVKYSAQLELDEYRVGGMERLAKARISIQKTLEDFMVKSVEGNKDSVNKILKLIKDFATEATKTLSESMNELKQYEGNEGMSDFVGKQKLKIEKHFNQKVDTFIFKTDAIGRLLESTLQ